MQKKYDITVLGEALIDFTPAGINEAGNPVLVQNPGGAVANVVVCSARLGLSAAMLGKVGSDSFGRFLKSIFDQNNVDTSGMVLDMAVETTLAFVHLEPNGDRDFSFYRTKGGDKFLTKEDVRYDIIENSKVFHFGSLSLTDEPVRSATFAALECAKKNGNIISYDPNWRRPLWENEQTAVKWMKEAMPYAKIVKVSEEELALLTGIADIEDGIRALKRDFPNIAMLAVTLGADGCHIACASGDSAHVPPCLPKGKKAIDTTGAGDCFMSSLLFGVLRENFTPENVTLEQFISLAAYANKAAGICVTRHGGIPSMPYRNELDEA